ncbi:restriction endonuclease subunit S [Allochromatium palmeri]|uniref:Type I restriction modification DNA specificity domain-containing protein n=1 Tax=Allochromatium palmeri TaxID=231048 RepID=A0A6N8EAT7_9GAMM|nr:restriction endonuclease subunit S [Allochromatium palmeri]MTW21392.1 hypothetical protein [Allochromatium palmeri]
MTPDLLLAQFDRLAEAPDAIPRLRRFILDLAVRGKLVEQDPNDEPAAELLKRVTAEKERLVKSGEIRKSKPSAPIKPSEFPIDTPPTWCWIRLSDLGRLAGGMTPSKNKSDYWDGDLLWLSPKDIKSDEISDSELKITLKGLSDTRLELFPPGSLFMVARSGILKRTFPVAINRIPAASNQDLKVLIPYLKGNERYLQIMFRGLTNFILRDLVKTGTTVQSLKYAEFESQPVPIPPLAEQHRIVAKVDELMALCDQLEAAQAEREQDRERLLSASLQRLNRPAEEAETFRQHARFVLDHLPRLTVRPEQIKSLRQTILNLAVRGRLVPQDPNDEPSFHAHVASESAVEGRLFISLPSCWSWARVEDVATARLGKMLDKAKNTGELFHYLRNTNVHWFEIRLEELKSIRLQKNEVEEYALVDGDILICEGGHGIGRTAVWRYPLDQVVFQKALHRVRPGPLLNSDFFSFCINVYFNSGVLQRYFTGVGIPHFTGKALSKLTFPLPPIAEQHRIVAKVDELMAVCDQLEAHLSITHTDNRRLLEAVLHDALAPALADAA